MAEQLERRAKWWFMYQNPTPSSIEIYTENEDWEALRDDIKPMRYDGYNYARNCALFIGCKFAESSELEDMLKTVKMLAKWKRSHEEKS